MRCTLTVCLHVENGWLHGGKIPKGPADNCLDWNDVLPVLSLSTADIGGRGRLWLLKNRAAMGCLWVKPVAPAMVMKEFMSGQTLQSLEVRLGKAVVLEVMRPLGTKKPTNAVHMALKSLSSLLLEMVCLSVALRCER